MKYFKVHLGYDTSIRIDETELEKVISAQLTDGVAVLKEHTVKGNYISLVEPDYVRAMGWNEGYKPNSEDWGYINGRCGEYKGYIESIKNNIIARLEGRPVEETKKIVESGTKGIKSIGEVLDRL